VKKCPFFRVMGSLLIFRPNIFVMLCELRGFA
jgi:hypothetical protein